MKYAFISIVLLFCATTQACECLWQGSFSQSHKQADLIVSGQISTTKGNAIDLAVSRILQGKEFLETIRIWVDNGQLCRPRAKEFPPGSQWVMALHRITDNVPGGFNPNTPNISYGRVNDYYLSKCGGNWLKLEQGYVTGNLVNGPRWVWEDNKMNSVSIELIDAYIKNIIPERALVEAVKPQTASQKLMDETKLFLQTQ